MDLLLCVVHHLQKRGKLSLLQIRDTSFLIVVLLHIIKQLYCGLQKSDAESTQGHLLCIFLWDEQ